MSKMNGSYELEPPNPKRGLHGEDLLSSEQSASSKKPRFDYRNPSTLANEEPDEEEAILELDEIGKKGPQNKRNAVRLEGFESDSSDDNFDTRAEEKAESAKKEKRKNKGPSKDEEMNDMFADLEEEDGDVDSDTAKEGKKQKKAVRFIDEDQIEGQVNSSKAGGHVSADFTLDSRAKDTESSSDSEGDDEERDQVGDGDDAEEVGAGAKKRHAPRLDAFHMKNEKDEGRFDENMNFVRNAADPFAVHDAWLADTSKSDMKKAREAHSKREEDRRQRDIADDSISTADLLAALISRLEPVETVIEALARLGSSKMKKKKKPKWQRNKRESAMDVEAEQTEDPKELERKKEVEAITAAADQLMTRGQLEIYDAEKGLLQRQYKRETGKDWVDEPKEKPPNAEWQYRWPSGEVHGPFDQETMRSWFSAGYLDNVEFSQDGLEWTQEVPNELV